MLIAVSLSGCDVPRKMTKKEISEYFAIGKEQLLNPDNDIWKNGDYYYREHQYGPDIYEEPFEHAKEEFQSKVYTLLSDSNITVSGGQVFTGVPAIYFVYVMLDKETCKRFDFLSDADTASFSIDIQNSEVVAVCIMKNYPDKSTYEGVNLEDYRTS